MFGFYIMLIIYIIEIVETKLNYDKYVYGVVQSEALYSTNYIGARLRKCFIVPQTLTNMSMRTTLVVKSFSYILPPTILITKIFR